MKLELRLKSLVYKQVKKREKQQRRIKVYKEQMKLLVFTASVRCINWL
jgi:hypothetical protein